MREDAFEFVDLLGMNGLIRRVVARGGLELREHLGNIDRNGFARTTNRMLMNHMAGNGKKIGFGAADSPVPLDPHPAQIPRVLDIAQAHRQKPTQPRSVPSGNGCDEVWRCACAMPMTSRIWPR